MSKWLVYRCVNTPIEKKIGYNFHTDYEGQFDTKEAAEVYIKQRNENKKNIAENDRSE